MNSISRWASLPCVLIAFLSADIFAATYTVDSVSELRQRLENAQNGDVIRVDGNGGNNGVYTYSSSKYNIYSLDGVINISTNYLLRDVSNVTIKALNSSNKPILRGTSYENGYVFYGQNVNGLTLENIEFERGYKGVIVDRSNNVTMDRIKVSEIGQEGVHIRDGSDYFVLRYSEVTNTGLQRADRGEAVYLCNDRKQWNPAYQPSPVEEDKLQNCDFAYIHDNVIGPNIGNNGVDVKEGTVGAYIENNTFLLSWTRSELLNYRPAEHPDTVVHLKGTEGVATGNTFNYANAPSSLVRSISVDMQLDDDPVLALVHGFENWATRNTIINASSDVYAFKANSDGGATYGCNSGAPDSAPSSNGTDRRYTEASGSACNPPAPPTTSSSGGGSNNDGGSNGGGSTSSAPSAGTNNIRIRNANNNRCLQANGSNNGDLVISSRCDSGSDQSLDVQSHSTSPYLKLKFDSNSLNLDAGNAPNNRDAHMWRSSNHANRRLQLNSTGEYFMIKSVTSGKCLRGQWNTARWNTCSTSDIKQQWYVD